MRAAEVVTAGVLILLGALVLMDAARLGYGWGSDGPQSGFFPFWLALIMSGTCAVIIFQEARRKVRQPFVSRERLASVSKVLWPAVGAVAAMHFIGLYVAAALYLAFYMRWVGGHHWSLVVVLALVIPLLTFFIFEQWFLVPMPKGPLEAWLGY
jgi:hypothetical protein